MDEKDFRAKQVEWDEKNLDRRVERWKQIVPATYDVTLPSLAWYYITKATEMYIAGHFLGVVLISAAIAEMILADKVISVMKKQSKQSEGLDKLVKQAYKLGVLSGKEANQLSGLRNLRNCLIHANDGELSQMSRERYGTLERQDAGFYLVSNWGNGLDKDALDYFTLVSNLTVKFYGEKD